jgi:hypothetical protein
LGGNGRGGFGAQGKSPRSNRKDRPNCAGVVTDLIRAWKMLEGRAGRVITLDGYRKQVPSKWTGIGALCLLLAKVSA